MQAKNPTIALIVAAGSSSRMGSDVPKPYINLAGRAVLTHVLEAFTSHPGIDAVRVVINRAHHPLYKEAAAPYQLMPPVVGGASRQESVRIGLEAIKRMGPAKVLIHDAARPLVDAALIDRVLAGLEKSPAVLPCVPVADTIRQDGKLIDRATLTAAQTPQGFHFDVIYQAHLEFAQQEMTDDIALAELAGLSVAQVEGSARNIKLTTPEQFAMVAGMMEQQITPSSRAQSRDLKPAMGDPSTSVQRTSAQDDVLIRVGQGFDVHAFEDHPKATPESEQSMVLCGIRIPHTQKLKGHSDADVGLHALVDAILGAIAEGDIGQHFPPSDPKWAGADSKVFLTHAQQLLAKKGGVINHVDLTIIGEQPKVSPHRDPMRQQVASLLGLDVRCVSIKATTTEKLGFLGRSEGLAAQAVVTVRIPA